MGQGANESTAPYVFTVRTVTEGEAEAERVTDLLSATDAVTERDGCKLFVKLRLAALLPLPLRLMEVVTLGARLPLRLMVAERVTEGSRAPLDLEREGEEARLAVMLPELALEGVRERVDVTVAERESEGDTEGVGLPMPSAYAVPPASVKSTEPSTFSAGELCTATEPGVVNVHMGPPVEFSASSWPAVVPT
jgi:hypothetical protein